MYFISLFFFFFFNYNFFNHFSNWLDSLIVHHNIVQTWPLAVIIIFFIHSLCSNSAAEMGVPLCFFSQREVYVLLLQSFNLDLYSKRASTENWTRHIANIACKRRGGRCPSISCDVHPMHRLACGLRFRQAHHGNLVLRNGKKMRDWSWITKEPACQTANACTGWRISSGVFGLFLSYWVGEKSKPNVGPHFNFGYCICFLDSRGNALYKNNHLQSPSILVTSVWNEIPLNRFSLFYHNWLKACNIALNRE